MVHSLSEPRSCVSRKRLEVDRGKKIGYLGCKMVVLMDLLSPLGVVRKNTMLQQKEVVGNRCGKYKATSWNSGQGDKDSMLLDRAEHRVEQEVMMKAVEQDRTYVSRMPGRTTLRDPPDSTSVDVVASEMWFLLLSRSNS